MELSSTKNSKQQVLSLTLQDNRSRGPGKMFHPQQRDKSLEIYNDIHGVVGAHLTGGPLGFWTMCDYNRITTLRAMYRITPMPCWSFQSQNTMFCLAIVPIYKVTVSLNPFNHSYFFCVP